MSLWKYVSIREDVFNKTLDEKVAPSLYEIITGETSDKIYSDPEEFINITYVTESLKRLVNEIINVFASGNGKIIILPSTFGGGKTHAMILLYHLIKRPDLLSKILDEKNEEKAKILSNVNVIVIDGLDKRTAPSPMPNEVLEDKGVKIRTLWGYIAYKLNAYDLVKQYDDFLISPERSILSQIFSNKKVLILIDEIGMYYNRLYEAPDPEIAEKLEKYAKQVVIFLRVLSESIGNNSVAVVISIPAEPTERGYKIESGYEKFVEEIDREILRKALVAERPIATDIDYANVLKKRLFTKIDTENARLIRRKIRSLSVDHPDLIKDLGDEIEEHYPFHPLYIYVLREIVEKNKDLQKTRDALKITRKVVRNLFDKVRDLSLIMPSDIDIRVEDIRSKIVTNSFTGFDLVVNKIIGKTREIPVEEDVKPEIYRDLAFRLALYIFLRTYIYDPHLEPRSEYPGKIEIISGVYDPERFEQYLISPVRVSELLDKITSGSIEYRVPHLYSKEGYYWVTRLLDIEERVIKESEKIDDVTAQKTVLEILEALYTKPYEGRDQVRPAVFSSTPEIMINPSLLREDSREYKLIVIATPLTDIKGDVHRSGDLYDIIYYRLSGREKTIRRNRNTITILFSTNINEWREIIRKAKMIIACDRLDEEIKREYQDERIVKILRDELRDMKRALEREIRYRLVSYFNYIAYPTREGDADVVKVKRVESAGKTLVEIVEDSLRKAGKVLDEKYSGNFDVLLILLEGPRAEKWSKRISVNDVINTFFEVPRFPMIPPNDVKKALLSGLKDLKIGVLRGEKIYFKEVEGLEKISELEDDDMIIPPEEAAEQQIELLSEVKEETVRDTIVISYYVAVYGDKEIPVRELKSRYPDDYIKIFIRSDIKLRREIIRRGFDLKIEPREIEINQEEIPEEIVVKILIKSIGGFREEVSLKPEIGKSDPLKGIPDFESIWMIPPPKEPGEYIYKIVATSPSFKKDAEIKILIRRGKMCKSEPSEKILEIKIIGDVEASTLLDYLMSVARSVKGAKIVRKSRVEIEFLEKKAEESEKTISIDLRNISIDDMSKIVRALASVFGVTAVIKCKNESELAIIGDGIVEDMNSILSADNKIKQRGVKIIYCR